LKLLSHVNVAVIQMVFIPSLHAATFQGPLVGAAATANGLMEQFSAPYKMLDGGPDHGRLGVNPKSYNVSLRERLQTQSTWTLRKAMQRIQSIWISC
jgi:hypothetical protein